MTPQNDKDYTLLVRIAKSGLGHVGFSTVTADGRTTHYDFAVVGAGKNYDKCQTKFNTAAIGASVAGYLPIALAYAATGFFTAFKLGAPLPMIIATSVAALVYSSLVSGVAGAVLKSETTTMCPSDETFTVPITKEQFDKVQAYAQKHRFNVYSLGLSNCASYTQRMMKACGVKVPARLCFNTPAHFSSALKQHLPKDSLSVRQPASRASSLAAQSL